MNLQNFRHYFSNMMHVRLRWASISALVIVAAVSSLAFLFHLLGTGDNSLLIGSFGASAVLVFAVPDGPFSQPRSLIGGHFFSALSGLLAWQLLGQIPWLAAGCAVGGAAFLMLLTATLHPPGGGTALVAVTGGTTIHALGFSFLLIPVLLGSLILFLAALICNNLGGRHYPTRWF